jgi:hypothetical protein
MTRRARRLHESAGVLTETYGSKSCKFRSRREWQILGDSYIKLSIALRVPFPPKVAARSIVDVIAKVV